MYDLLSVENAEIIKKLLLNTQLSEEIEININKGNISLLVTKVSENHVEEEWGNEEFYLENEENDNSLVINNKNYWISIKVGWWRDTYRIPNAHITLGTDYYKFGGGHKFFSQLELSQALEDKESIYLLKNITNLSGEGSISRLNSGLKDRNKKINRRNELIRRLDGEIIRFDNYDWLIVTELKKNEIYEEENHSKVFTKFLNDFLKYSFTIEEIILEDKE